MQAPRWVRNVSATIPGAERSALPRPPLGRRPLERGAETLAYRSVVRELGCRRRGLITAVVHTDRLGRTVVVI